MSNALVPFPNILRSPIAEGINLDCSLARDFLICNGFIRSDSNRNLFDTQCRSIIAERLEVQQIPNPKRRRKAEGTI